jgi:hypothetical protein
LTERIGIPFGDACMRSLIATGWLNFRMCGILHSFASYYLGLDRRVSDTAPTLDAYRPVGYFRFSWLLPCNPHLRSGVAAVQ